MKTHFCHLNSICIKDAYKARDIGNGAPDLRVGLGLRLARDLLMVLEPLLMRLLKNKNNK